MAGEGGEGAERMGDGLFVHASNSLAVISIGCSIIVPFQGGKKKKKKLQRVSVQHSDASSAGRKFKGAGTFTLICHAAIFGLIWRLKTTKLKPG